MSDTPLNPAFSEQVGPDAAESHQPKHRLEGVPVDAIRDPEADIANDFGSNPDTSLAG